MIITDSRVIPLLMILGACIYALGSRITKDKIIKNISKSLFSDNSSSLTVEMFNKAMQSLDEKVVSNFIKMHDDLYKEIIDDVNKQLRQLYNRMQKDVYKEVNKYVRK